MSVIANNTSKLNPQTGIGNVSVVHCSKNNSEVGRKIPNKQKIPNANMYIIIIMENLTGL